MYKNKGKYFLLFSGIIISYNKLNYEFPKLFNFYNKKFFFLIISKKVQKAMTDESSNNSVREKLLSSEILKANKTTNFISIPSVEGGDNNYSNSYYEENKTNSNIAGENERKDSSDSLAEKNFKFDALTNMNIIGYGVGHFINDLAAAGWFNYLTIYLKSINPIDPENAGFYAGYKTIISLCLIYFIRIVLLSGQIADGIATPLIGYLSDKTNTRIGKRMPWYNIF